MGFGICKSVRFHTASDGCPIWYLQIRQIPHCVRRMTNLVFATPSDSTLRPSVAQFGICKSVGFHTASDGCPIWYLQIRRIPHCVRRMPNLVFANPSDSTLRPTDAQFGICKSVGFATDTQFGICKSVGFHTASD